MYLYQPFSPERRCGVCLEVAVAAPVHLGPPVERRLEHVLPQGLGGGRAVDVAQAAPQHSGGTVAAVSVDRSKMSLEVLSGI